jgi:hypothetical protein
MAPVRSTPCGGWIGNQGSRGQRTASGPVQSVV